MPFKIRAYAHRHETGRIGYQYAQTYDFKQYMGMQRQQKWPEGTLPPVEVPTSSGPTTMYLLTAEAAKREGKFHRCYVGCPTCGKEVPAGRTHQHKCKV